MMISGIKAQGISHIGKSTLETIGTIIFHYDYRFNAIVSGGRVSSWGDLGPNAATLTAEGFRRFYSAADGFGDGGNAVAVQMNAPYRAAMKKLHDGSPFLWFAVVSFPAAPDSLTRLTITSQESSRAGQEFAIINTTGVFRCVVQNDSDSAIINNSSAAIPTNEFILLMRQYYGSGTGSNNTKTYVKSTLSSFTNNPTFGTGDASSRMIIGKNNAGAGDNWKLKTVGCYDLTGKSTAQIDSFQALFIQTLKSDSEYSALVTP
jgi:hypothetical protein